MSTQVQRPKVQKPGARATSRTSAAQNSRPVYSTSDKRPPPLQPPPPPPPRKRSRPQPPIVVPPPPPRLRDLQARPSAPVATTRGRPGQRPQPPVLTSKPPPTSQWTRLRPPFAKPSTPGDAAFPKRAPQPCYSYPYTQHGNDYLPPPSVGAGVGCPWQSLAPPPNPVTRPPPPLPKLPPPPLPPSQLSRPRDLQARPSAPASTAPRRPTQRPQPPVQTPKPPPTSKWTRIRPPLSKSSTSFGAAPPNRAPQPSYSYSYGQNGRNGISPRSKGPAAVCPWTFSFPNFHPEAGLNHIYFSGNATRPYGIPAPYIKGPPRPQPPPRPPPLQPDFPRKLHGRLPPGMYPPTMWPPRMPPPLPPPLWQLHRPPMQPPSRSCLRGPPMWPPKARRQPAMQQEGQESWSAESFVSTDASSTASEEAFSRPVSLEAYAPPNSPPPPPPPTPDSRPSTPTVQKMKNRTETGSYNINKKHLRSQHSSESPCEHLKLKGKLIDFLFSCLSKK